MKLQNETFKITTDAQSGATTGIYGANDPHNWILNDASWGLVDGFSTQSVTMDGDKISVTLSKRRPILLKIEKYLEKDCYVEKYTLKNQDVTEFFLNKDRFGIPFPYNCLYTPGQDVMNNCCISHVWCGGDCAWLYSVRCHGGAPYLSMKVTQGAVEDYSILYDTSRTDNGSFYRGAIVVHPEACIISPGEEKCWEFQYRFTTEKPETAPLTQPNEIRLSANKYSVQQNEPLTVRFESNAPFDDLTLSCDGKPLSYTRKGNVATALCAFEGVGEKKIVAVANGKKTWMHVRVMLPISEILQRRARFITQKQQYLKEGSPLHGAYLIYDDETDSLYYDESFSDHNAARERIVMGIIVCKALQKQYDEAMMASLLLHRAFIEREMFDAESGIFYNQIARNNKWKRYFNLPWASTYYLEWYLLTGEKQCLLNAANIMLRFFEWTGCKKDAQCIEIVRLCQALKKEGLDELHDTLKTLFLQYADGIEGSRTIEQSEGHVLETSYVSEHPNCRVSYLSQAYLLDPKAEYHEKAQDQFVKTKAFFAHQPDFHMDCVGVRYWDRFWFGKRQSYGDLFPHYWSALAGWGMIWYDRAFGDARAKELAERNLTGNLCVYREDGFAANNYLYPYKVELFSSKEGAQKPFLKTGVSYGKNYDAWANDQDWALYYALLLIE